MSREGQMSETPSDIEKQKKAVFESMSPKRQKHILKKGYEAWDPFEAPNDPIDMRKDKTKRTSQALIRSFLQDVPMDGYSNEYARGAFDICLGIINEKEKYQGMYDFACWYRELLKKEGHEPR